MDEDSYFYFVDRRCMIKRGGEKCLLRRAGKYYFCASEIQDIVVWLVVKTR
ncbi:hypothetical protein KCP75_24930 [Salmonella enterica subsp. enterica]|nr:hypothetical protein KCP75_24930 [Salmonella enterica subsp. enterica]